MTRTKKHVFENFLLLAVCLGALASTAHAGYRIRSVRIAGERYLLLKDVAGFYGMRYRNAKNHASLTSKYSRLEFRKNQRQATINGVQVYLSHACGRWRDELTVSKVDFQLVLEPLLRSQTISSRPIKRIVIDPGHGGKDPGAQNSHTDEKDITLAVAKRLYDELKKYGYRVYLTRTDDEFRSLNGRAALAGRARADVFVSLHANAVAATQVHGIESYLLTPEGTPSTYTNSTRSESSPGNAYDAENTRLAFEIQRGLLKTTGARDRGTKHANFAVLRNVPSAAVLVEMGFLTNPNEAKKLRSPSYQRRLALGIARGVRRFHQAVAQ